MERYRCYNEDCGRTGVLRSGELKCVYCNSEFVEILEDEQPESSSQQQQNYFQFQSEPHYRTFFASFPNFNQPPLTLDFTNLFNITINNLSGSNLNDHHFGSSQGFGGLFRHIIDMLNGNFQGQSGDFVTDENFNNILNQLFQMYSKKGNPPASKDEVKNLKTQPYKKKEGSNQEDEECAICKMDFEDGDSLKEMPCHHHFHVECIEKWLGMSNFCPLCRYELKTDDEDYEKLKQQKNSRNNNNNTSSDNNNSNSND